MHGKPRAIGLPREDDRLALVGVDLLAAEQRARGDAMREDRGVAG